MLDLKALKKARILSPEEERARNEFDDWQQAKIDQAIAANPRLAAELEWTAEEEAQAQDRRAAEQEGEQLEAVLRLLAHLDAATRIRIEALSEKARARLFEALMPGAGELDLQIPAAEALEKLLARLESKPQRRAHVQISRPPQAELFDSVWRSDRHVNSVAIYDLMPKYVLNSEAHRRVDVQGRYKHLPVYKQDFENDGREYSIAITPARLAEADGVDVDYYPGEKEHVIEMALRRLMIGNQRTEYFHTGRTPEAGLRFTLSELRRELIAHKADFNYQQIRQAISVMNKCHVDVRSKDGQIKVSAPLLPNVAIRQQVGDDDTTFVTFHPLITAAITQVDYRRLDYASHLKLKHDLTRWLHIRLVHAYTQASQLAVPYNISGKSMIRDYGLQHQQVRDAFRKIRQALDELKAEGKISSYTVDRRTGARKAIIDEIYTIRTTAAFGEEQKNANFFQKAARTKAESQGIRDAATGDS